MSQEDSPSQEDSAHGDDVEPTQLDADGALVEADDSLGLTQAPFDGWMAFADLASETSPAVAGILAGGAYVIRAAVEAQIPSIASEVRELLSPSLSQTGRDNFDRASEALRSNNLPLTAEAIATQVAAAFTDALTAYDDPNRLTNAAIEAFLDSELIREHSGRARYEQMKADVAKRIEETGRPPIWEVFCSLELPSVLDNQTPIYCARRVKRDRYLDAVAHTYKRELNVPFGGRILQTGPVGSVTEYIDEERPEVYRESIPPGGASFSFALQLIEAPKYAILSKVGAALGKKHHVEIKKLVEKHEEATRRLVEKALKIAKIPLDCMGPIMEGIGTVLDSVVNFILDQIEKACRDVHLTPWTVVHTAIMGTAWVPISIFTLSTPGRGQAGLCRLDTGIPDPDQASSRFLIGSSSLPPPTRFHSRCFDLVAKSGQPLAWQEPFESSTGFRILVPHLDRELVPDRAGRLLLRKSRPYAELAGISKRLYVSALRTDVHCRSLRAIPRNPNPIIIGGRRPESAGGDSSEKSGESAN